MTTPIYEFYLIDAFFECFVHGTMLHICTSYRVIILGITVLLLFVDSCQIKLMWLLKTSWIPCTLY